MSDSGASPPVKRRSWLLIVSLALNLLVLGMVGGAFIARHRMGGPPDMLNIGRLMGEPGLRGFVQTLPKERRIALRAGMSDQLRQKLKPLRETAQLARAEATLALIAEPFDAGRLENAMLDLTAAETAVRQANVAILVASVALMTPFERAQFRDWRARHEKMPPTPPSPADQGSPANVDSAKPQPGQPPPR